MKKIAFVIFAAALVAGTAISIFTSFGGSVIKSPISFVFGSTVKGSGNVITETRNTESFDGVDVSGILNVEITQSDTTKVVVDGDDNIVPIVRTVVKDGTLRIWSEGKFDSKHKVTVRVSAPSINNLESSGVSRITFNGFDGNSLSIDSSGASNVNVSGTVESLQIDMSGASKVNAINLKAERASVEGSGASSADVSVVDGLNADMSGASGVNYKGDPAELRKSVSGAASVTKLN